MTSRSLFSAAITAIAVIAVLSGCGRKGALELPPASVTNDQHGQNSDENSSAQKTNKPFFLDPLIP